MAGVHYPVIKRVRREETQLNLDSRDGMDDMSSTNRGCADLTESNIAGLALFDQTRQKPELSSRQGQLGQLAHIRRFRSF